MGFRAAVLDEIFYFESVSEPHRLFLRPLEYPEMGRLFFGLGVVLDGWNGLANFQNGEVFVGEEAVDRMG